MSLFSLRKKTSSQRRFPECYALFVMYPAIIYLFKVNNKNTRKRYEICSKLTIKTGVFIVNFEHILHIFLLLLLSTLNKQILAGYDL